jgi:molybdate transport system ATP-binding protein
MPSESSERVAVEVDVRHQLGTLALTASIRAAAPWTVLFGPSGSGKSTILRTIAGLVRPDEGAVSVLGERVVGDGVWVPPHLRRVRWAGQRAALFPRETVGRNIAMGADAQGKDELDRALEVFGLRELQDKRPAELSGGERQRVSVVRAAIGARGRVLLLDEPFAGLDAGVRDGLIAGLREWLGETPVISVTHDVGEACLLGAEVVRVDQGKVVAQGVVGEVLGAERERLRGILEKE